MNRIDYRSILISFLSGAALLAASLPAAASDNLGMRVATGVGRVIASQGNVALERIKEELQDNLLQTLKPLLPDEQTQSETLAAANRQ